MSNNIHFLDDSAISNPQQDLFNFKFYAGKIQKLIQLNSSNPEPITIGIYGKWGEGKTSFLNLIEDKIDHFEKKEEDKEYLKFHFNPWRYSNEDEMLFDFFDALSKKFYVQESTNLQEVGKWISKYSKYLKAVKISATVGLPKIFNSKVSFDISEIFQALGEDLKGDELTLDLLKNKVNETIKTAKFKVVVFIDDLDRLDKEEIYTILKLIKLNANFSNFIFIVNIDSDHVAKAIKNRYGDDIEDGHFFLEKIINIPIHLPKIEDADLREFFRKKLEQVKVNLSLSNSEKAQEMFKEIDMEFSSDLFSSPREIIRVLNSFFLGAFAIGDEVNLRDLFWIEYLKIKNGECYNFIKSYHPKSGIMEFDRTVDFNDDYNSNEKPNGTRKDLLEKFKNVNIIINNLFPVYNNGLVVLGGGKPNLDLLDRESRINSLGHYEKYFSFHNIRKTSVLKLNTIENLISENDSTNLISLFKDLFLDETQNYKVLYRIELIIKELNNKDERNFFYLFLFNNFDLIPNSKTDAYGLDYRLRLIELIASTLNKDTVNDNTDISLSLSENLDVYQLSHFTRKFNDNKSFKRSLQNSISSKAQKTFSASNPVYKNPSNAPNKMIMHYWKLVNNEEYNNHIESTIINEENIKLLVRNFPSFWNNSYFGPLEKNNYDYMKQLINVDFIYQKEKEFNPKLIKSIDPVEYHFSEIDENTPEENLEQFIYWYKKEKEDKRKLLLLS
ncbi:P-loop NTPase fold protein [Flavobacterium sp. ASV13]|uniref:KAP family P-loop NTPase fold protein n=1 Tax=Flavobacterium sp. ASV13 TaxID=1506583 RepID=UPI000558714D|nr:P-loop NTPase fold protein [Flavobacterium sp. ASV13]